MNKDNILFGIIGLLLGLIIGFFYANSTNQRGLQTRSVTPASQNGVPPDHPPIQQTGADDESGMQPAIKQALDKAKNEPNNMPAQVQAAELYTQVQQFDEAIKLLMRANQMQPDNYEVLVQLGNTNYDAENYEAAVKWYTAAIAKKPDDVNVLTDLGLAYMFQPTPDVDKAIDFFQKALKIDPKHEKTLQDAVFAYTRKGDAKNAQSMLDRLTALNAQNPAIPELQKNVEALKNGNSNTAQTKKG